MPRPDPFNDSAVVDWIEVEKAVDSFESAKVKQGGVAVRNFLPSTNHPLYERVLRELIRIELEDAWTSGKRRLLEEYRSEFPILFGDREGLGELAFEEYRLRRLAGESVAPAEYERRYGIETTDWPQWDDHRSKHATPKEAAPHAESIPEPKLARNASLEGAAQSYLRLRLESDAVSAESLNSWLGSCKGDSEKAEFFRDLHLSSPEKASQLAEGLTQLPDAGTEFLGFRLVSELGRGAFGRVYLAKQGDLANRSVALKVAADVFDESQTLAQLQHTNIVPIYSIHRAGKLQAVCMPYFGLTTLADILSHVESQPSLPDSGKFVISTLNNRRASTQRSGSEYKPAPNRDQSGHQEPAVGNETDSEGILNQLAGYSYVQAILWMASRLADGLAHAHGRGILHRDLKPANVLLTDEGQPMLLDFNLSADLKGQAHRASVGGTLPYMAPEHLDAFRGRKSVMDARSDIYALGVMMYELLAGKRPFPSYRGESESVLKCLVDDRVEGAPLLRNHNPDVSPAVESIVRKCLAPELHKRYQTAADLHEDLERQLKNLPLKHAPEPSLKERTRKWMRRHPRVASTTSISLLATLAIFALGTGLVLGNKELARFNAAENLKGFRLELSDAQSLLLTRHNDAEQLSKGEAACKSALARFGLPDNKNWRELSVVRNLPAHEFEQLQSDLGELLLMLASSTDLQADFYDEKSEQTEQIQLAMTLNTLAESCYRKDHTPRAVLEQREELAKKLGKTQEAEKVAELLSTFTRLTSKDDYLSAHKSAIKHSYRDALKLLEKTTQNDPTNFPAWFVRGNCYSELVRYGEAIGCFNVCVALRPDFSWGWLTRGLAHLELKHYDQAIADFTKTIELQPNSWNAYLSRGLARKGLSRKLFPIAIEDLTEALKIPGCPKRVYFERAEIHGLMNNIADAQRDMAAGSQETPTDEEGWIARGFASRWKNPLAAVADFDEALKINPHSFNALQNKAAILDERCDEPEESLEVIEKTVSFYPDSVLARGGRGVLLARQGKRAQALADAEESLLLDSGPPTLYQVACIYSVLSVEDKSYQVRALSLLSGALRAGFAPEYTYNDPDMDPLRALPAFAKALAAAKELAGQPGSPQSR